MTPRHVFVLLALATVAPAPLVGQTVNIGARVARMNYQEISDDRTADGWGAAGSGQIRLGRFGLAATILYVPLSPTGGPSDDFDLLQLDLRASYAFTPFLSAEIGGGRRFIDPDFVAQEVGLIRVGLRSENRVTNLASFWLRGAYLFASRFTGGGSADLAFELGLGVGVGTPNGRFRVQSEYEFQRIDREVGGTDVPIQTGVASFGIVVGF